MQIVCIKQKQKAFFSVHNLESSEKLSCLLYMFANETTWKINLCDLEILWVFFAWYLKCLCVCVCTLYKLEVYYVIHFLIIKCRKFLAFQLVLGSFAIVVILYFFCINSFYSKKIGVLFKSFRVYLHNNSSNNNQITTTKIDRHIKWMIQKVHDQHTHTLDDNCF